MKDEAYSVYDFLLGIREKKGGNCIVSWKVLIRSGVQLCVDVPVQAFATLSSHVHRNTWKCTMISEKIVNTSENVSDTISTS